jgi:hypothetical protein
VRRGGGGDGGWPFLPGASTRDRRLFTRRRIGTRVRLLIATAAVVVTAVLVWLGAGWV